MRRTPTGYLGGPNSAGATKLAPCPTATVPALSWRQRLYLAMVAVLPLHTVFLSAWISWKPFIVLSRPRRNRLVDMVRERRWLYRPG
jgi:hypothetical protein